jgi:Fe-S oxidoreductase
MKREMGVYKEQRELLTHTKGVELVEMKDCDNCCGFGGAYMALFPEVSKEILAKKVKHIEESGAEVVDVDCPGCLMQIEGGLDARDIKVDVKHTATIIAEKRGLL